MKNNCSDHNTWWPTFWEWPQSYTFTSTFSCESIYHKRCNAIKEQLKKNNIIANVSRSVVSHITFYRIETKEYIYSGDISRVLGLKSSDVGVITSNKESCLFLICEKLLHNLYLDCNNELTFNFFNFYDASCSEVKEQLKKVINLSCEVTTVPLDSKVYYGIYTDKHNMFNRCHIAKALDIDEKEIKRVVNNHCWLIYHHCG